MMLNLTRLARPFPPGLGRACSAAIAALPLLLPAHTRAQAESCESLAGVLEDDTIISEARALPEADALPAHCLLRGVIEPRIGSGGKQFGTGFELRLPRVWSGRFLMQGGGGWDGTVNPAIGIIDRTRPEDTALSRGIAVASTDAGHYGDSPVDPWWAIDTQARHDNGYRSARLVTERSRELMQRYYGSLPKRSYFMGCSNGGRQGMVAATRYPEYFDGILAGAPAFDLTSSIVAWNWNAQALKQLADAEFDGNLAATFSDAELTMISAAAIEACDSTDGLSDNLVMASLQCRFDPGELTCEPASGSSCLTPGQVEVLKNIQDGPRDKTGDPIYAGWNLAGIDGPSGFRHWIIGARPGSEPSSLGGMFQQNWIRYIAHTPPDPDYDAFDIDLDDLGFLEDAAPIWDATSTDYKRFADKGGKIIFWHPTADPAFSTAHLAAWFNRLIEDNGGAESTAEFARLYLVPGMHHCAGGRGLTSFDALTPLIEWVENGTAPATIEATGDPPGSPEPVTRPLCPYPAVTMYDERGFACRVP